MIMTVKAALVAAAAVGTAAVGGITYAAVSSSQTELPAAQGLPSASVPAVPASPPVGKDCLPAVHQPNAGALPQGAAAHPLAGQQVPTVPSSVATSTTIAVPTGVPTEPPAGTLPVNPGAVAGKVPAGVPTTVPTSAASCLTKKVPGGLPTTVPGGVPTSAPTSLPTSLPTGGVPSLPKLDCSKIPAAVAVGGSAERSLALPGGLRYNSSRSWSFTSDGQNICAVAQTWKDQVGQYLQVERLTGNASLEQLRQALKLPAAQPVTLGGTTAYESPLGSGEGGYLIWAPQPGTAMYVSASPAYATQLNGIAAKLGQLG